MSRRALEFGVAIGPGRLWAVELGRRDEPRTGGVRFDRPIGRADGPGGEGAGLTDALRRLREDLGVTGGRIHVALLPPLARVRRLELPRLPEPELRRVLSRGVGRYFPGAREPHVVGAEPLSRGRASPRPLLAAAAPQAWVDTLMSAAEEAGWAVASVVPAHAAWRAAVGSAWPDLREGPARLAVLGNEWVDVIGIGGAEPGSLRRIPRAEDVGTTAAGLAALDRSGSVAWGLVGAGSECREIATALESAGASVAEPVRHSDLTGSPGALAAGFAARSRGPYLLDERRHLERRRRAAHATLALTLASVILLLLGAALELWGLGRELQALRRQRAELRPAVAEMLMLRGTLASTADRALAVEALDRTTPRWSLVLANLAPHIPRDAHLTAFRAHGDTLWLAGTAGRTVDVIRALGLAPGVANIRLAGSVRHERADGRSIEHFELIARLSAMPAESQGSR